MYVMPSGFQNAGALALLALLALAFFIGNWLFAVLVFLLIVLVFPGKNRGQFPRNDPTM